jgi:hypothetical protein
LTEIGAVPAAYPYWPATYFCPNFPQVFR